MWRQTKKTEDRKREWEGAGALAGEGEKKWSQWGNVPNSYAWVLQSKQLTRWLTEWLIDCLTNSPSKRKEGERGKGKGALNELLQNELAIKNLYKTKNVKNAVSRNC